MSLETRLKKLENSVKKRSSGPDSLILYEGDDEEAILLRLKAEYGESYEPKTIIRLMRPIMIDGKELKFNIGN